jgi:hypothetical protein
MIRRRTLFALPLLADPLLPSPLLAGMAVPARAAEGDTTTLAGIIVPAGRARVLAMIPLGAATAWALGFAADLPEGGRDLVALAALGRVLALELLSWHGADGSRLQTRLSAVPDRQRVRLERLASAPRGRGYRHEEWIDYLAWQELAPMTDAPVRPVLAGTWQAALAGQRDCVRALLAGGPAWVAPELLACCPAPRFPA